MTFFGDGAILRTWALAACILLGGLTLAGCPAGERGDMGAGDATGSDASAPGQNPAGGGASGLGVGGRGGAAGGAAISSSGGSAGGGAQAADGGMPAADAGDEDGSGEPGVYRRRAVCERILRRRRLLRHRLRRRLPELLADGQRRDLLAGQERDRRRLRERLDLRRDGGLPQGSRSELLRRTPSARPATASTASAARAPACGTCQACMVPGLEGKCAPVARFVDDDTCNGTNRCDGLGECRRNNGSDCKAPADCVSLNCVDGVCCNDACDGTCFSCNLAQSPGTCLPLDDAEDSSATHALRRSEHLRRCRRRAGPTAS